MKTMSSLMGACAFVVLGAAGAYAGPCTTGATPDKSAMKDAGSGPTSGNTGQAPSMSGGSGSQAAAGKKDASPGASSERAGTPAMSQTVGDRAASPSDVRKQTAGQATDAQVAQGKQGDDC